MSHSTRGETEELERLASQLTLSETPKQVGTTSIQPYHDSSSNAATKPWLNLEVVAAFFNLDAKDPSVS